MRKPEFPFARKTDFCQYDVKSIIDKKNTDMTPESLTKGEQ